jgi:hypothetical protein
MLAIIILPFLTFLIHEVYDSMQIKHFTIFHKEERDWLVRLQPVVVQGDIQERDIPSPPSPVVTAPIETAVVINEIEMRQPSQPDSRPPPFRHRHHPRVRQALHPNN